MLKKILVSLSVACVICVSFSFVSEPKTVEAHSYPYGYYNNNSQTYYRGFSDGYRYGYRDGYYDGYNYNAPYSTYGYKPYPRYYYHYNNYRPYSYNYNYYGY